jgi:hypothetical protein
MTHLLPPTHLLTWVGNLTKVKNREKLWLISICVHHENKRKTQVERLFSWFSYGTHFDVINI